PLKWAGMTWKPLKHPEVASAATNAIHRAMIPPGVGKARDLYGMRRGESRDVLKRARKKSGARFQRACFPWYVGNVPHILSERSKHARSCASSGPRRSPAAAAAPLPGNRG